MPRILLIGHINPLGVERLKALADIEIDQVENEQTPDLIQLVHRPSLAGAQAPAAS